MEEQSSIRSKCHVNSNKDGDTFVGIKSDGNSFSVCFPLGYTLAPDDRTLRLDVINLVTVLTKFSGAKDKRRLQHKIFTNETIDFPIKAYMGIIERFRSAGSTYYTEKEVRYVEGRRGKISWARTAQRQRAIPQEGSFVYLDYIVKKNSSTSEKLITLVHEYCVYESYSKLGWLYPGNEPQKPRLQQFDKNLFLSTVYEKLDHTFDDKDRGLFQDMLAMINYLGDCGTQSRYYFGTERFEYVWEKLIDFTFGVTDKEKYFPHTKWVLNRGTQQTNPALEPDTVMVVDDKIYVLDAKYYRYGDTKLEKDLPKSTSINKQITYGEYIASNERFRQEFGDEMKVYNAFLMPFSRVAPQFRHTDDYRHIGEAISDWKNGGQEYEHVQGILVDVRHLMHNYVKQNEPEILKLASMIEDATSESCSNTTTTTD